MKPKKDISQLFKDNQYKLNERPSPQAWRKLERRLDDRRSRGSSSLYRHTGMAAGVLVLITLISLIAILVDHKDAPDYLAINQPGPVQLEELTYTDVDMNALKVMEFTNEIVNRGTNITEGNLDQQLVPTKLLARNKTMKDASQILIQKFQWLVGEWEQIKNQQISQEVWSVIDNFTLEGKGQLATEQGKLLFSETMTLQQIDKDVFLSISLDKNQTYTKYQLVKMSDNTAVFENRQVDFPQLIILQKQAEDRFSTFLQNAEPIQMNKDQFEYLEQRNAFNNQYLRRDLEKRRNIE